MNTKSTWLSGVVSDWYHSFMPPGSGKETEEAAVLPPASAVALTQPQHSIRMLWMGKEPPQSHSSPGVAGVSCFATALGRIRSHPSPLMSVPDTEEAVQPTLYKIRESLQVPNDWNTVCLSCACPSHSQGKRNPALEKTRNSPTHLGTTCCFSVSSSHFCDKLGVWQQYPFEMAGIELKVWKSLAPAQGNCQFAWRQASWGWLGARRGQLGWKKMLKPQHKACLCSKPATQQLGPLELEQPWGGSDRQSARMLW